MKVFVFAALLCVAAADKDVFIRTPAAARTVRPTPRGQGTVRRVIPRGGPAYQAPTYTPTPSYTVPDYVERSYAASYQEPRYYNPQPYQFGYDVNDPRSGAVFSQSEQSDGTTTSGQYSVNLPDGCVQTVKYTADDVSGYRADVSYDCHRVSGYTPAQSYNYDVPSYQPAPNYDVPVYRPTGNYQAPSHY